MYGTWRGIDLDALEPEDRAILLEAKKIAEFKAKNPTRLEAANRNRVIQNIRQERAFPTETPVDEKCRYLLMLCNTNNSFSEIYRRGGQAELDRHKRAIEAQYNRWNLPEVKKDVEKREALARREFFHKLEESEFEIRKRTVGIVV